MMWTIVIFKNTSRLLKTLTHILERTSVSTIVTVSLPSEPLELIVGEERVELSNYPVRKVTKKGVE